MLKKMTICLTVVFVVAFTSMGAAETIYEGLEVVLGTKTEADAVEWKSVEADLPGGFEPVSIGDIIAIGFPANDAPAEITTGRHGNLTSFMKPNEDPTEDPEPTVVKDPNRKLSPDKVYEILVGPRKATTVMAPLTRNRTMEVVDFDVLYDAIVKGIPPTPRTPYGVFRWFTRNTR